MKKKKISNNDTILQYFEWNLPADQNHWNWLQGDAAEAAELGITMAWLPPAYKGAAGKDDAGYGVYDLYDLGEFDQKGSVATKFGTKDEYLGAVKSLQDRGIRVLPDVVLNHRMGADSTEPVYAVPVNPENRLEETGEAREIEAYTGFNFPGRAGKYSDFSWHWNQFSGVDRDARTGDEAIFRFTGKHWNEPVDTENGNFDFLMGADLVMEDKCTQEELERWGKWYFDTVSPDGFRLDAVKHIQFPFYRDWVRSMRAYAKEQGKEDLFIVGEYWHGDVNRLLEYRRAVDDEIVLFDVPLHYRFKDASDIGESYDLRGLMAGTLIESDPNAVTFIDNHDTQPGESLQSWVGEWFKPFAYSVILLQEYGTPCVFFGDYKGMPHDNTAPIAGLRELMYLRKTRAYGFEYPYFDDPNVVGFAREGDEEHPGSGLVVLFSNAGGGEKEMYTGERHKGQTYIDYLGNLEDEITIDETGKGVFKAAPGSASVWVDKGSMSEEEQAEHVRRLEFMRRRREEQAAQQQEAEPQETEENLEYAEKVDVPEAEQEPQDQSCEGDQAAEPGERRTESEDSDHAHHGHKDGFIVRMLKKRRKKQ